MTRILGVVSDSRLELGERYIPLFEKVAPELELRRPDEIANPAEVQFMFTFLPAADAFTPYPNLRAVFGAGAGVDAIEACPSLPKGLPIFRVEDPDQAQQMAGFSVFHVLWHHREMASWFEARGRQDYQRKLYGISPLEKRIGVMGFGHMGQAIARGLTALGYPVASYSRRAPEPMPGVTHYTADGLDDFLAQSEILINVLPLTAQTQGMIGAELMAKLPQGAAIIHIGRGGQLDETALVEAIDSGHLSGASVDVFETEPLPQGHPFWTHPKIFITPHVASIPVPENVVRAIRARMLDLQPA